MKESQMTLTETLPDTTTAAWKQRHRVEKVVWTQIAETRPDRGLAASDRSGRMELHAWEVPRGQSGS
jgi:hypothetical protein